MNVKANQDYGQICKISDEGSVKQNQSLSKNKRVQHVFFPWSSKEINSTFLKAQEYI